ncbi:neutral zinc metallopeptidase [Nonomuraea sp. SYSU D8015]|uniref:neutral zinc metallopeptidase n=1 Tax=Nonomuraea sp. SYSU D8015 TaxID=2593644 RepID=UPI00166029C5|nr:neutral zinc metallopeptidase [Nonomuraea sp. SYSU D8015]
MRIPRLALMAGALASVLFAGTAHAATVSAPAYKPALAKSPIYKTGKLDLGTCDDPEVTTGTLEEVKGYLDTVLDCLNAAWEPKIKKAGFAFSKPSLQVITKPGAPTGCGAYPAEAQALYCSLNKKITFLLSANLVDEQSDLMLLAVLAHEYGHHIQQQTGMFKALNSYSGMSQARQLDVLRRFELQAECLAGAFVGNVWHSLNRRQTEWDYIVKNGGSGFDLSVIGVKVESWGEMTHGKAANVARWLKRGFAAESAGGCNTWTAPKSHVS